MRSFLADVTPPRPLPATIPAQTCLCGKPATHWFVTSLAVERGLVRTIGITCTDCAAGVEGGERERSAA